MADDAHAPDESAHASRLSLCMIVRDNERTLDDALNSAKPWVDEMVVVDTGSTDATVQIAESAGAKVFEFPWCDDFAAARNESLRHARGDWLFWMDSDDTLSEDNGHKLRAVVDSATPESPMGYVLQVYCGDGQTQGFTVVDHVKLFRNLPGIHFEGRIHEQVLPSIRGLGGEVGWTDIYVNHSGADYSPEGLTRKLERDLRILEKDLEDRPDHPFVWFNLGMTQGNAGEHRAAVESFSRCIALSDTGESHLRKAYALFVGSLEHLGEHDEAQRRCWEGLGRFTGDPELLFLSGNLAQKSGRLLDAAAAYQDILDKNRSRHFSSVDPGITSYKTRQNLATTLEALNRWRDAEQQWRAIVAEQPSYLEGWRGFAENLGQQKRLADLAPMLKAIENSARLGSLYLVLSAKVAAAQGNESEACALLDQAIADYPKDHSARHERCRYLFESRSSAAEAALLELATLDPDNASIVHNLGLVCLREGRHEEAIVHLEQSLELRPDHVPTLFYLGIALDSMGQGERAVKNWEKVLRIDHDYQPARTALAKNRDIIKESSMTE